MDQLDTPIWQQVLLAAGRLSKESRHFRLNDLVREVQRLDPGRGRTSIQPVVQGMTRNGGKGPSSPCGKPLERIDHGIYRLVEDTLEREEISLERPITLASTTSPRVRQNKKEIVDKRVLDVIGEFVESLNAYDQRVPFTRNGQYSWHRATIDRRLLWPTVEDAIRDEVFVDNLYETLQVWGIGRRASRLIPRVQFGERLIACRDELIALELLRIDDPELDVVSTAKHVWKVIEDLKVVNNISLLVPGTKTLHHLLPDLVPPMDRAWTGNFFKWSAAAPQYEQEKTFFDTFIYFTQIAQSTNPSNLVGNGWRTSITKLLDNAIIGYSKLHRLVPGSTALNGENSALYFDSATTDTPEIALEVSLNPLVHVEVEKRDSPNQVSINRGHIEFQENDKGISYNYLFGPYVQKATKIQIIDPYVRSFPQIRNLMEFIETVRMHNPGDTKVILELLTIRDEDTATASNQMVLLGQVRKSATDFGIVFSSTFDDSRTIHDRSITTDTGWKIILGRGLDIYQSISNDRLNSAYRNQELRKVRRFGVTYIRSAPGAQDIGN